MKMEPDSGTGCLCQVELFINISPVHNYFLQPENRQYFGHDITVYVILDCLILFTCNVVSIRLPADSCFVMRAQCHWKKNQGLKDKVLCRDILVGGSACISIIR